MTVISYPHKLTIPLGAVFFARIRVAKQITREIELPRNQWTMINTYAFMYPFNHSHRSFGWSLSLCSLLHIVGSFAKFQTGNGNEIVIVRILIDDKQPRGRESNRIVSNRIEPNRIESNRIESDRIRKGTKNFSPERNELRERNETKRVISFFFFFFSSLRIQVSLNIAPRDSQFGQHARFLPPFVQGMKNSRSREIFPRNANYLR